MCEQTEINYLDGEVVWVKLGSCWWPGEVVGPEKLPPDVLPSFRKPPIAVVKFFQEDTYEYVKNINSIYKYNCSRKNEFINKGLYMYRTKHGPMEKFPEDVIRAETAVGGDIEILTRDEFQETKKESYAGIFGDPKKTPTSTKKGRGRGRTAHESPKVFTPIRKVKEKTDYKVHILVQGSTTPVNKASETPSNPSTSRAGSETVDDKHENVDESIEKPETPEKPQDAEKPVSSFPPTPTVSSSGMYACHACSFSTTRLNVLILHNKTHSVSFTPYTPSPAKKKISKSSVKSTPTTSKTPKTPRPRKEKQEKSQKKTTSGQKRPSDHSKTSDVEKKKAKTEQDFKKTLLADWDDADEDSNDESPARAGSPEVAAAAESPAVPTPAELPSAQVPGEMASVVEKKPDDSPSSNGKPESSSYSKYEFCEDEDWPVEAGVGRKIPRVKNPSKRKDESKSLSLDDDEMAREVAELLTKTAVPELPSVPEPLKVEENFPEPSVVKSPDKQETKALEPKPTDKASEGQPSKAIFKTKTFFRSRHSRSQDAIGKYVAEQLNAVERMDMAESEINGSDAVSSPEARESPPIEPVKVARLAPKIQLKRMKAAAAQLREKEKSDTEFPRDDASIPLLCASPILENITTTIDKSDSESLKENDDVPATSNLLQDVLYPTQEIKPINEPILEETKAPIAIKDTSPNLNMDISLDTERAQDTEAEEMKEDQIELEHTIKEPEIESVINESEIEPVRNESEIEPVRNESEIEPVRNESEKEPVRNESEIEPVTKSSKVEPGIKESEIENNELAETDNISHFNIPEPIEQPPEKVYEPYMNESTASAVDALLSVSRDADRVTRVISDDPPEDLFEDDNKEIESENMNGFNEVINEECVSEVINEENVNEVINEENVNQVINEECVSEVINEENVNAVINEESFTDNTQELEQTGAYDGQNPQENGLLENKAVESLHGNTEKVVSTDINISKDFSLEEDPGICEYPSEVVVESVPSESDLQVAEALINLPATAIQNKNTDLQETVNINIPTESVVEVTSVQPENMEIENVVYEPKEETKSFEKEHLVETLLNQGNEDVNARFETELEKNENLNAAQSLVQMSESIDHKINIIDAKKSIINKDIPEKEPFTLKQNNGIDSNVSVEQKVASLSKDNNTEPAKPAKYETTSSKLLKILEEPCAPKFAKTTPMKQIIIPGKEKILNFDVAKSSFKSKTQAPVIIRRAAANKNIINNLNEMGTPEKIILSRSNKPTQDGSSVQTYTIQTSPDTPSDANTITIIQQKVRKIQKPPNKLQKIKPQTSLVTPMNDSKTKETTITEDAMFDINSMPIVLSDDILTPESIEKMPIVMSDGNLITNTSNPPKLVKTKQQIIESDKSSISSVTSKPEIKTLLMNPVSEVNKVATPNILSKSSKLRGAKPMLVIDKATGKQKIIMTKAEPTVKEIKQAPTLIQPVAQNTGKADKFLILPTTSSPRPGRTQKIVIDPQTGKAHVLVAKGPESSLNMNDNKPVSAKLIPSSSDAASPGNTVMIITNAQGAQSRIVLTSEHEKILFPNKQQPNVSQLKTITHKITTTSANPQKTIVSSVPHVKTPTRIVPKQQKSAIITSKGQLIVGGRVATTAQNIAPMPEIRPVQKRIVAEPKKLVQAIQKTNAEPLIFLQQKSGTVVQLTASQFEHFQKTGQIIQKIPVPSQEKPIVQKTITVSPAESVVNVVHKPRVRKTVTESPTPAKRVRQEIAIAPAHPQITPMPALTPLSNTVVTTVVPAISNTVSVSTTSTYPDLDNFEEMLPSTAIARQLEPASTVPAAPAAPAAAQPEPAAPPAPLSDGQLLAVPGEHFGGPPGSFYLCVEDNGTLTPIDNRPLVLENNQLVPMAVEPLPILAPQPERRDILEAALANSDVFHADPPRNEAPDFRDLNANVSVHCRVSETSTTLNQPIMTPVEVPSKGESEPAVPSNLEDGLAVIGVTPHTVPTSLELPITVTDPRIAPKTTDPLSGTNYGTTLLPSPNTEMTYITTEEVDGPMCGPISMPLLTDDESVGKSMPILTDEVAERTVSSVESTIGSPSSIDVRESETEDGGQWSRRLLTPGSDTSETSSEIPLQPAIQLSVNDMSRLS
ncbi:hypothetical protein ABMA27_005563 [Loxostege sticticalis]|uniref:PWWP domain-containing protein n=1 Tax=Loxostege sticticalis TaxID=481309 RepID=A0ABR3HJL3_LOXSC